MAESHVDHELYEHEIVIYVAISHLYCSCDAPCDIFNMSKMLTTAPAVATPSTTRVNANAQALQVKTAAEKIAEAFNKAQKFSQSFDEIVDYNSMSDGVYKHILFCEDTTCSATKHEFTLSKDKLTADKYDIEQYQ